ncbi:hypothetical protein H839_07404 [Parageobacillus genomosp. 1]|uniref:Uncharacterized protein n=1 Tax=Parageobacillus genomosp. 1 TaxID=1295642 RepID=A0ABC9VFY9_9BACL|nr:hypothetical protein H839_07404 [Parageobacillus genomosp. 1]
MYVDKMAKNDYPNSRLFAETSYPSTKLVKGFECSLSEYTSQNKKQLEKGMSKRESGTEKAMENTLAQIQTFV